ncbi:MAG: G5 domain-containing protein [Micromonosporaceae bacterium]
MNAGLRLVVMAGLLTVASACSSPEVSGGDPVPTPRLVETPSATPSETPSRTPEPSPSVEVKTVVETRSLPFSTRKVNDSSLAKGVTKMRTQGVRGVKTLTYQVTFVDGKQTSKKLVREEVTRKPTTEVIAVGTKVASRCDPNYSGCVPIASDVDCAGGSGNGPAYVTGPVRVIGTDIYDLDRDGDGIGCD